VSVNSHASAVMSTPLRTPRDCVLAKLAEQASAQTQIAANLSRKCVDGDFDRRVANHAATAALFTRLHKLVEDGLLDTPEARRG
jgi:hypothetical protein